MKFSEMINEKVDTITFNAKNTDEVEKFLKKHKHKLNIENTGKISVEIDGNEKTIFKGDTISIKGKKIEIIKMNDKRNLSEATIALDGIGKDSYFIKAMADDNVTFMIKGDDLLIVDKKDFKKAQKLLKDNGYSPKAISESEIVTEAIDAKKVLDYYISTMKNIEKFGKYYSSDKSKVSKMERRMLSDYAGNDKKLKEIYKQLTNMANILDTEMTDLENIIG